RPWMDMALETLHCDGDSIVLRFIDPAPVGGLGKMLRGLPSYRYRVDTVEVSSSGVGPNGEHIEVNPHKVVDTTFAHVTVPCEYGRWRYGNRLMTSTAPERITGMSEYTDSTGKKVTQFYTGWEFAGDTLVAGAREMYDTIQTLNPRMEGDRFILEVVLKSTEKSSIPIIQ
ncbi:MAG: hypothetical protein IKS44_05175, partial [Bacteroidales bacterium]|nr:hypothetical protein [Bacteroidales bacterium]